MAGKRSSLTKFNEVIQTAKHSLKEGNFCSISDIIAAGHDYISPKQPLAN